MSLYCDQWWWPNEEKLLGILLGTKLNFNSHIKSLCKKAGQKFSAPARTNHYLTQGQKLLLLNSVVKSQFSYCSLIWMFNSRYLNNALNSIHERLLRLIYNDYQLPFDRILDDTKQKNIHQKKYWVISYWNLWIPSSFITTDHKWPICHQGKQL